MAGVAAYPQKSVLKLSALQVVVELAAHMVRQALALLFQLFSQGRVVRFDEFVEQRLLGSVLLIVGTTNGILAIRQYADRASLR